MVKSRQESSSVQDVQPRRFVVLGASNVALSIGTIFQSLLDQSPRPLELLAAHGHGRSYGTETSVLGRRLPAILDCGLWTALAEREACPARALVTDIGNDLIYGQSVEVLLDWVRECLDRLSGTVDEIVVTQLPVTSLQRITPTVFTFMTTIVFPRCELKLPEILRRAEKFSQLLESEIQTRQLRFIEPQTSWYGWDPIHVRRGCRSQVWRLILDNPDQESYEHKRQRLSFWQNFRIKCHRPQQRVLFGVKQHKVQPIARFRDGSTISFF